MGVYRNSLTKPERANVRRLVQEARASNIVAAVKSLRQPQTA